MSSEKPRLASRDGIRGAAAFVVVVHHTMLTVPVLAGAYFGAPVPPGLSWLVYSPLHLLWDGAGPVFVFFVLSGLVVPLPALSGKPFSWSSYYPQRLLRLYLPVWGSLVLAYATVLLVPHTADPSRSEWVQLHAQTFNPLRVLRDGFLLAGSGWANSPLWTLQWEVLFSLLLPAYVVLGRLAQRSAAMAVLVLVVCVTLVGVGGQAGVQALTYLPMFGIGVALAARLAELRRIGDAVGRYRFAHVLWPSLVLGGLLALSSRWWLTPVLGGYAYTMTFAPIVLGATALVVVACVYDPARRLLSSKPFVWAGRLSFSLYLIHDPIVVTVSLLLPASLVVVPQVIGVMTAVLVAVLFQRFVEQPSHRLARAVGGSMKRNAPARTSLRRERTLSR